ncbi:unnamed protein product [Brassicogethes aeneus]|uniref:ABC-2 type transporter transmembrane domain-containing protein n=1 Tax=Brassicogethes aeneus TaxID=1431903 RepID=A0A9P0AVZ8_BRAAE|nr:unnamed protein product [Brassicogethes aeneus]
MTIEKESPILITMKVNGLPTWRQWAAWFCELCVYLIILSLIMISLLSNGIFSNTNPLGLIFYFLVYAITSIMFCFAVGSFFCNVEKASAVFILLWLFSYAPYMMIFKSYDSLTLGHTLMSSLWHTTAMAHGMGLILKLEALEKGFQLHNAFTPVTTYEYISVGGCMGIMLFDRDHHIEKINWPPLSPDMNPIEHVWSRIKLKMKEREEGMENLDELVNAIQEEWGTPEISKELGRGNAQEG